MKNLSSILLFVGIFFFGCEKHEVRSSCEDLPAVCPGLEKVQEEIQAYSCITNIYEGIYEAKRVLITSVVDPVCLTDGSVGVYDCFGEFIDNIHPGDDLEIGKLLVDNR